MSVLTARDLTGVFTAVITPMFNSGEIDFAKLEQLVEDQIAAGVAGVVPCGTTGQSATLTHEEHIDIAIRVAKQVKKRCKVIVSAGSNSTREAIHMSNQVEKAIGPVTLLHVTGYYNCPPQEGIRAHFETLADSLLHRESNIVIYNVPGRTACPITAETLIALSAHPQIIGVKEVSSVEQAVAVANATDSDSFRVLSGEDPLTAAMIAGGATGTISGAANLAPKALVDLVAAAMSGDEGRAAVIQRELEEAITYVYSVKNPIPLGFAFDSAVRLPLCFVPSLEQGLRRVLERYTPEYLGIDLSQYRKSSVSIAC